MRFSRIIRLFTRMTFTEIRLFLETFFILGLARFLIALPFSRISTFLGKHMDETPLNSNLSSVQIQQVKNIRHAIEIASKYTPWESKCLVKAITAMSMLKRRGIESTLYLGTAKEEGGLIAHAWLRSGDFYVTGADVMKKFTVVAKFAKKNGGELYGRNI
ncbi:lasso peptide biosynthesis B2 protein [Mesobacillus sp.]|uniref:lasso peptide biosynthesis B2 protein n=1 Tax=Mesobacillus sp. TaxID=2675271 RepID=UPI0039F108A8